MKNIVLLFVVAAFVVSPAMAAPKDKKSKQATEAEEIAKQRDNSYRLVRDGLPLLLPSWSLPIFFNVYKDGKIDKSEKTKK